MNFTGYPQAAAPAFGGYSQISPYGQNYMSPPQMQQQAPQNQIQQTPPSFGVRPVTGREEAVASQVDFGGPGTLMPDLSHGVIYLKRFNQNTGSCDIFDFKIAQPEPPAAAPQYATVEELNALRDEFLNKRAANRGGKKNEPDE